MSTATAMIDPDALAALHEALAAAQADAALWRERTLSTREILNLVEDVSDNPSPDNVAALVDAFNAWRMCVERGVPQAWGVAGEPGDGHGPAEQPAETECPF